ncbi:hypothetical protein BCU70_14680 [Vibrio sp. 10N.286.49.C2]|uniref:pilus assembly protein PilM n=1 Tax=unclassified Vibrio TaxID=2614977 RepID=UPI000C84061F|nr:MULTISPECIES: pilus assembly protein PilM [unclassified Vibrio]PMH37906.1 hypothetical protein BCU70_14680 [Vibrio sp. 10N.286.49.C2]PMH53162.1 hypothetical protein BCU66_14210 [Vibrio sp. 10N.286.49.B1]PMH84038.1 hypothetical protein BCU58_12655 [Vibrio sp. 10N.286.48.B7]
MTKKWITGIDIGRYSVKAVVVKVDCAHITIVNHLELKGSDSIFSDPHTLKHQETVKNLKKIRKTAPFFRKKAAIALPDSVSINKVITLEHGLDGQEQVFAVFQAMAHQTPYPLEELALDFYKEPSMSGAKTEAYRVHVVKHAIVDNWTQPIKKIGYRPEYMDTNINALRGLQVLLVQQQPWLRNWGVLDLGHYHVALCPPQPLSQDMAKQWSYESHERTGGSLNSITPKSPAEVMIEHLTSKILAQLKLYRSIQGEQGLQGIVLCGGHANDSNIACLIERLTGMPIKAIDLHACVDVESEGGARLNGSFATALGVAYNAIQWMEAH